VSSTVPVVERIMTPFGDTVVLEMLEDPSPLSKIVLPQGARVRYDRAKRARIVDVGPDCKERLHPGQEVLVAPRFDGVALNVPGTSKDAGHYTVTVSKAIVATLTEGPDPAALYAALERILAQFDDLRGTEYEWVAVHLAVRLTGHPTVESRTAEALLRFYTLDVKP
jgi:hypothetical protein